MNWYLTGLRKYAVFSGRAGRKEYWMFVLINVLIGYALLLVDKITGMAGQFGGPLYFVYAFATLLPGLAVAVRRLHDTGRSGFWLFLLLVPIVGAVVVLVFLCQAGNADSNRFGPNPKAVPV